MSCLPCLEHWDLSDPSDLDDIDEAVNSKLLSLSNPQSREGNGNQGSGGLWSLQCLLWSWPLGGWCGNGLWSESTSLGVFFKGEPLVQSNLKGCWVDRFTHGHPGPLSLYSAVHYGLGNCPSTFLNCHWIQQWGRLVSQPVYPFQWVGMWHPWPCPWLDPPLVNVFHKKGLPYLVLSPLLLWGQSWFHAAYLPLGVPSRNEGWGYSS